MKQTPTKRPRPGSPAPARSAKALKKGGQPAVAAKPHPAWRFIPIVVLVGACILRLLFLDLKPLHHDEGVNGFFLTNLFRTGYYHYDPANYHGPTLYYFGLTTATLNAIFYGKAGLSTFAIRLVTVTFGTGLIWLVFLLRRYLGNFATLVAATLLAVSPGMVYFSRYFIHEIPFVFFTLALVITAFRYGETAEPRYLMMASASAAFMFATKETCIISFAVLALAWICTTFYLTWKNGPNAASLHPRPKTQEPLLEQSGGIARWRWPAAAALFIAISVLFYSSFFTNWHGVLDSLRTFQIWTHTGVQTDQYQAPWWRYFEWMGKSLLELPVLVLGVVGIAVALWKARNRFAVFAAFWALGITAAYSLVPYKTPWLALNLILPLGIMSGYGLAQWYETGMQNKRLDGWPLNRVLSVVVFIVALAGSAYQAIDLSFFHYDDNAWPYFYVYAHTSRQLVDMVDEIEDIASRSPTGKNIGITVASPEYWPLPWYFRDYPQAIFWGKIEQTTTPEPILIASEPQQPEVEQQMGRLYRAYKSYDLRPGNVLVLYLRRDIQP